MRAAHLQFKIQMAGIILIAGQCSSCIWIPQHVNHRISWGVVELFDSYQILICTFSTTPGPIQLDSHTHPSQLHSSWVALPSLCPSASYHCKAGSHSAKMVETAPTLPWLLKWIIRFEHSSANSKPLQGTPGSIGLKSGCKSLFFQPVSMFSCIALLGPLLKLQCPPFWKLLHTKPYIYLRGALKWTFLKISVQQPWCQTGKYLPAAQTKWKEILLVLTHYNC